MTSKKRQSKVAIAPPPQLQHRDSMDSANNIPPPPTTSLQSQRTTSSTFFKKQQSQLHNVGQLAPITQQYALNNHVLQAFYHHYTARLYQVAYAVGVQFVETALLEIPRHGYFLSPRHERDRMQSRLDAVKVLELLQEILALPTNNGSGSNATARKLERERLEQLHTLALEQVQQASEDQYTNAQQQQLFEEQLQRRASWQQQQEQQQQQQQVTISSQSGDSSSNSSSAVPGGGWVVLEPLLSCSESMSTVLGCDEPSVTSTAAVAAAKPASASQSRTSRDLLANDDNDSVAKNKDEWVHIQPSTAEDILLEKALYLSGLEVTTVMATMPEEGGEGRDDDNLPVAVATPLHEAEDDDMARAIAESERMLLQQEQDTKQPAPTIVAPPPTAPPQRRKSRLEFQTLSALYHDDFDQLFRVLGRIQINYIGTWQGRIPGSTNGCTVIAPLLCIHHLLETDRENDGLDQDTISQVIDMETPVILQELRNQLGLADQAFLIPSDVHDHLIQNGQLHATQFINCIGGNILDESHLANLIRALHDSPKKLTATLFFHEHVVAILKIRKSKTECYYDIIDNLPMKETLMLADETPEEFLARHDFDLNDAAGLQEELQHVYMDRTAVFRCLDAEALKACLRWYACSKFSEANVQYIDTYDWDDSKFADFDPRVFQAFLWGMAPTV